MNSGEATGVELPNDFFYAFVPDEIRNCQTFYEFFYCGEVNIKKFILSRVPNVLV